MSRWERLGWKALFALLILKAFLAFHALERAANRVGKAAEPYLGVNYED